MRGYYRFPHIHEEKIVFVCEDDIWLTDVNGKTPKRLTSNLGEVTTPYFSTDGKWIAFVGREEGNPEVYVIPSSGGKEKRVTYLGSSTCAIVGWNKGRIIFATNYAQPFKRITELWEVDIDGNNLEKLPYGYARNVSFGKGVVIGRNTADPATWKRYKGGRAGEILISLDGKNFNKLINLNGNFANPMWIGERIYFVCDHEGIGNIYSCLPDGSDLRKHTNHADFYVRNASTDGKNIVYHSGGDLYILDVKKDEILQIPIDHEGPRIQTNRKFVDAAKYLEDFDISSDGKYLVVNSRGKSVSLANWEGPVIYHGKNGVRYRLSRYLSNERIVFASDDGNEDHIEIIDLNDPQDPKKINVETGRPVEIKVSPKSNEIVLSNHKNELMWIDLESAKSKVIDRNAYSPINGFNWSSDGRWIAYACNINRTQSIIKVYDTKSGETHEITKPVLKDMMPVFDPLGRYLYIISLRVFNPVYDKMHFALGFPKGMRPYLITLRKDLQSPFVPLPKGFKEDKKSEETKDVFIDFDGIKDRIVPFPVEEGIYTNIGATKDRIFYTSLPVEGAIDDIFSLELPANATLKYFDLTDLEEKTFLDHVSNFKISQDGSAMIVRIKNRIRVLSTSAEVPKEETVGRKGGLIDLTRIKISVDPILEWQQMLKEAWRLQRDYFWREDMSGVEWKRILDKYYPLVERISSRSEFSDLIWEMQGELGTSHAYELGGDYRPRPEYKMGFLGADVIYDSEFDAYKISRIIDGDPWTEYAPPIKRPGVNVKEGDLLIAINGQKLSREFSPGMALVNMANQEVQLTIKGEDVKNVWIKVIGDDTPLRYREWVEKNRRYVYQKTNNRVGYIHIPDMMALGYAEFHRYFLAELDKEGLIVDVRFNSGGEVSQLLLEKLARKRIGYDSTRWMGAQPYPTDSPYGPVIAVTNEYAGSDGDIFSHAFKLMKIGKLIGRRTWGGVIGIWPRNWLVDGTITTQPEMSFWFTDVGWGVENYGTDPDIEVDILPQDIANGRDPQLDKAIEEIIKEIDQNSPIKPFESRVDKF
ncbi:S41 family peptidase [Athalassotoga saccharophila]|uniref:S41 family peptidase n=1 Tax=Athalassotoga saccharophila TaxID=1441386 RepID=UPI00137B3FF9|nr:S41 family peptidase [Athalassotoga saccharophila]BBJ27393.1 peptidase S41 [Athalassotoga saccharophila]